MKKFGIILTVLVFMVCNINDVVARNKPGSKILKKRSTDDSDASRLPVFASHIDLNEQLQGNTPYQSSYFLGQCLMCPPGPPGPTGSRGIQGIRGRDGRDSILVQNVDSNVDNPWPYREHQRNHSAGSQVGEQYTRWGRTSCSSNAELIYEGVMAGSHVSHTGGASNYLCLTKDPIFYLPQEGIQHGAFIYGTEYETMNTDWRAGLQDNEVPCAVCLATSKSLVLMVPGRNVCPEGRDWTEEYRGYIMSQHHATERTMYVCVDSGPEGIPRTHGNHEGAQLFHVEAQCVQGGGIPCPPYVTGYELTCVVCSL